MPSVLTKLRVSASQLETAQICLRKWYMGKVLKLPQPFDRNKMLGEVGHEVLERYRQRKELYPEGWTSPTDRFTGLKSSHHITTTEQALLKALVTKAISEGVVVIEPDGQIEREFGKELGTLELIDGINIKLIGFIDYCYGNTIEDHKFIGPNSGKYYGLDKLKSALAMNIYAYAGYREGFLTDPTVWLRYNLFVKDLTSPQVSIKHVEKTKEEIFDFFEDKIRPLFKPMVMAAKNCSSWEQVDNAMCKGHPEVCKKYGGCEYLDICLGKISVQQYRDRFAGDTIQTTKDNQTGVLERLQSGKEIEQTKGESMSKGGFLSKMKQGAASSVAGAVAPKAEEKKTAPVTPAPAPAATVAAAAVERIKAPWAFDGCPMCRVSNTPIWGINKKNEPCNICRMNSNAEKESGVDRPVLEDFEVSVSPEGAVTWMLKGATAVTVAPVEKAPVIKEAISSRGGDEFPPNEELVNDPAELRKPEVTILGAGHEEHPLIDAAGFISERTGKFMLSYSVVQNRSLRTSKKLGDATCIIHISEFLELVGTGLLEVANKQGAGASNFLDIDYYVRRDLIARNAKEIAESLGNSILEASNIVEASMEHVLCAAIERYASWIIGTCKK